MSSAPVPASEPQTPAAAPHPHIGFWQKKWVQALVPLGGSLAIHASILVLGFLLLSAAPTMYRAAVQEQIIVPDSTLAESGPAGGIPNPGLGEDPNRAAAQDAMPDVAAAGWAQRPSQTLTQALVGDPNAQDLPTGDSVIGVGAAAGLGRSRGAAAVSAGEAAQLAPFGVPGGGSGALGPRVSFIGVGGNARKVVYLVDASGSMLDAIDRVKRALADSIDRLSPIQEFAIVVFRDDEPETFPASGFARGTVAQKRAAAQWVATNYYAAYGTKPAKAIREAFSRQPELVYILSDGFDVIASFDELKADFRKNNRENKVKVNTLLIRSRNDPELENVMREIAEQNGGVYKPIERNAF